MMPSNQYVEVRNGGYYVAGTRIGLDVVYAAFHEGHSPESIFQKFPSIGSLGRVYGVIAFLLDNPAAVEAYLLSQDELWKEFEQTNPTPPEMLEGFKAAAKAALGKR
ncbi:MAG: DUF433 domain-containing protein [Acidobacteria bacterium]|nr:DUF433 domain-containing protein [Acidobacteriota bacterium]